MEEPHGKRCRHIGAISLAPSEISGRLGIYVL